MSSTNSSGTTQVIKDFATPDRAPPQSSATLTPSSDSLEERKDVSLKEAGLENTSTATEEMAKLTTVTPPESAAKEDPSIQKKQHADSPMPRVASQVDSPEDRHVRFDKGMDKLEVKAQSPGDSSTGGQRGLVSRRGGRCSSPGRVVGKPSPTREPVLEFKTYRSPSRKKDENDTVPSLCSATTSSTSEKEKTTPKAVPVDSKPNTPMKREDDEGDQSSPDKKIDPKPASISYDSSVDQTSPLTSHDSEQTNEPRSPRAKVEDTAGGTPFKKNNVTFSPVPPARESVSDKPLKTPTKSPTGGHFQSLPNLDDAALRSPVGIFLSPHPPTPLSRTLDESTSFDKHDELKETTRARKSAGSDKELADSKPSVRSPKTPRSPRTPKRETDRERFVTTPTDFAMDYGKHPNSASFDTSNVLAWLQSPTANGLFSPGGFGSIMNTPRGPRTPRTPTVSTSFFFSDVAGLPRSGDYHSPKPAAADVGKRSATGAGGGGGAAAAGGGGSSSGRGGYSNIICISPLASSKAKSGGAPQSSHTPTINYKDMFASPAERTRGLSLMGDSPANGLKARGTSRTASRDPSVDAVHMAERDLMEDEDLSVLLQLASNTPRPGDRPVAVSTSDGTHVFRSPNGRNSSHSGDENLPSLQLPIIGGRDSEGSGARLSRKTHSRDHGDPSDDYHRPVGIRSSDTVRSKDSFQGKHKKPARSDPKDSEDKRKDPAKKDASKKSGKAGALHPPHPPYPIPPHPYAHPDNPYYPPLPPGIPPHAGAMRVVVGAPPPSRTKSSGSPHGPGSPHAPRGPYPMGPGDPKYPPPPYPPPPGHYPHHPGVPPPPPRMHPHYSHYPPPHHPPHPPHGRPHMPMYGAQHPPSKSKPSNKKLSKQSKSGSKRSSPSSSGGSSSASAGGSGANASTPKPPSAKKSKKSSPSSSSGGGSGTKKKTKSPQLTDRADRQKAAAAIQAVNAASGGKNDRAAALAAAILRGVTMRPSGKWQAQLYFAGKSRYIGVFDTREKAALAYEIAREKLKSEKSNAEGGTLSAKATEAAVNSARKAAFEGVNERDPRLASK